MSERFVRIPAVRVPRSRHGLFGKARPLDADGVLGEVVTSSVPGLFAAVHRRAGVRDTGMSALFWDDRHGVRDATVRAIRSRAPRYMVPMGRALCMPSLSLTVPAGLDARCLRLLSAEFLQRMSFVVGGGLASEALADAYAAMLAEYVSSELSD